MDEDIFDDELQILADELGVSIDEAAKYRDFLDSEEQKDIEHAVFLEENGLEGIDLDSGEFY